MRAVALLALLAPKVVAQQACSSDTNADGAVNVDGAPPCCSGLSRRRRPAAPSSDWRCCPRTPSHIGALQTSSPSSRSTATATASRAAPAEAAEAAMPAAVLAAASIRRSAPARLPKPTTTGMVRAGRSATPASSAGRLSPTMLVPARKTHRKRGSSVCASSDILPKKLARLCCVYRSSSLRSSCCAQGVPHPPVLQRRRAALRPDQLLPRRHRRVPRRRPRHTDHALHGALGSGESDLQRRGGQGHRRLPGRG